MQQIGVHDLPRIAQDEERHGLRKASAEDRQPHRIPRVFLAPDGAGSGDLAHDRLQGARRVGRFSCAAPVGLVDPAVSRKAAKVPTTDPPDRLIWSKSISSKILMSS